MIKRPATKIVAGAAVIGVLVIVAAAARVAFRSSPCGDGFHREGARCFPLDACSPPLVVTPRGCDSKENDRVRIPETTLAVGPSDWEAEGRVKSRTIHVHAFYIDRVEVTVGRARCATCPLPDVPTWERDNPARAVSGVSLDDARDYCAKVGGRLPTEDEWIVAAAGAAGHRYPWGDTGAVCRRAAWGLLDGPCATGGDGADTVGAHPDGTTSEGVHDLAGNVAEWVETGTCPRHAPMGGECIGVVRGGSWKTSLASDLRTWSRREVSAASQEPWIGFRCAYD
jgi:formylglycine-generating enzyme required for sulfatase activity